MNAKLISKFQILLIFEDLIESCSERSLEEVFTLFEIPILKNDLLNEQDQTLVKKL